MIYRLSMRLTKWFIQQNMLKQEDLEVYAYYIDTLLNKMFFYGVILSIASILHIFPETIWYYFGFIPFRYTAGGFHARSEAACVGLSWAIYGISMLAVSKLHLMNGSMLCIPIVFVLLATIIAWKYAPVEHMNKPVASGQKQKLRHICLGIQGGFFMVIMLLLKQHCYKYAFSLSFGNGIAAIFLLLAFYQAKRQHQAKEGVRDEVIF